MTRIDTEAPKYLVVFKRKDQRRNQRDDKLGLFRSIIGLEDVRDILDLQYYKGSYKTDPIQKTPTTITDNNGYDMKKAVGMWEVWRYQKEIKLSQLFP